VDLLVDVQRWFPRSSWRDDHGVNHENHEGYGEPMGRRPLRTREQFVEAAMALVDKHGLEKLSTRELGAELGVVHTSIYTHFPDKGALIDALIESTFDEVPPPELSRESSPRRCLSDLAVWVRTAMARHPRLIPVVLDAKTRPARGQGISQLVLAEMERAGLSGHDLALAYRSFENYVVGATLFDHGGAPEHLTSRAERYDLIEHPALAGLDNDRAVAAHNEEAFLEGLDRFLAGWGIP
jgi:AcrR family transcriptional regulator